MTPEETKPIEVKPVEPKPVEPVKTTELTIDGKKVLVTDKELIELAQKGKSADQKYQEAADLRKQGQRGLRISELTDKLDKGLSREEMGEYAGLMGMDISDLEESLAANLPNAGSPAQPKGKETTSPVKFEQLDKDVQEMISSTVKSTSKRDIAETRREIEETSKKAVDKDELLGKVMSDSSIPEDRKEAIRDLVFSDVQRRILAGETYGTELVTAAVLSTRRYVKALGIPGSQVQQPVVLGLAPGTGLPTDITLDKPIERVSSTDAKYEESALRRYTQLAMKMAQDALRRK